MNSISVIQKFAVAALVAAGLAAPVRAAEDATLAYEHEVDTCLAAVNSNLDLTDANRVRHVVTQRDRTGIGYVFTISTSVFGNDGEKHYEAYCVASGLRPPVKFRIDEKAT